LSISNRRRSILFPDIGYDAGALKGKGADRGHGSRTYPSVLQPAPPVGPEELANVITFLLSGKASNIDGSIVSVDGGVAADWATDALR
jgi:hypothetical protein